MLLMRYMMEDYPKLPLDQKADLYVAIRDGRRQGSLSRDQVSLLCNLARTNDIYTIALKTGIDLYVAIEELNSALEYLAVKTGYLDAGVFLSRKGKIDGRWITEARRIARTWL